MESEFIDNTGTTIALTSLWSFKTLGRSKFIVITIYCNMKISSLLHFSEKIIEISDC